MTHHLHPNPNTLRKLRLVKLLANPHQRLAAPGARGMGTSSSKHLEGEGQTPNWPLAACPPVPGESMGPLGRWPAPLLQLPYHLFCEIFPLPWEAGPLSSTSVASPVATAGERVAVGGFCIFTPQDGEPPRGVECGFLIQSPRTWHPPGGQRVWTVEQ